MRVLLSLPLAALLLAGCCGYSTHALMRGDLQRVAVLPAENSTAQPGLADEFTELLADAFNTDRRLRVTALEAADLSVSVRLTEYSRNPAAYSGDETISAYDIVISAAVACDDRTRNEEHYSGTVFARTTYDPAAESEEAAAERALKTLAADIVRAIITKW